jgi:hypothetical protein
MEYEVLSIPLGALGTLVTPVALGSIVPNFPWKGRFVMAAPTSPTTSSGKRESFAEICARVLLANRVRQDKDRERLIKLQGELEDLANWILVILANETDVELRTGVQTCFDKNLADILNHSPEDLPLEFRHLMVESVPPWKLAEKYHRALTTKLLDLFGKFHHETEHSIIVRCDPTSSEKNIIVSFVVNIFSSNHVALVGFHPPKQ